jgi:glutathione S-transferase
MTMPLVFYSHPMSRGRIARWMLEEVGQPYTTEIVDFGPPMKTPAYRSVNPMGKVPALRHGDVVITETAAIVSYLADAFPHAGLAPATSDPLRGVYYRWMFFGAGPIEAAGTNKALGFELPPDRGGMAGYGSLNAVVETLKDALAGRQYLVGETFTAADLYVGSHLGWMMQFGTFPKEPEFQAYVGALMQRPASVRARQIDDALLAAHPHPFMKA